jgi:O-antigen/teichoic acid export membrane protein
LKAYAYNTWLRAIADHRHRKKIVAEVLPAAVGAPSAPAQHYCVRYALPSGRLLARNVGWNLLGAGLPLIVALWAIPALIKGLGTERFGLLAIIWMGVGYFSLFDLGMGRALTKLVAERLGDGRESQLPLLISTGLRLMFGLGMIAALTVALITPWLAEDLLNVSTMLTQETVWSLWILAGTLPFVVSTAGLIGVLQAHQRFREINAVRIPLGVINFLGPILALAFTPSLVATTLVLAIARILAWLVYRWLCQDVFFRPEPGAPFSRTAALSLLSYGSWITVTNIIGPLMVYFDRFFIGALLTMSAVAYYTIPYEVVTRLWILPEALMGVLFPALTTALATAPGRAGTLFFAAARTLLITMFVPIALVVLFAPEALTLWLSPQFAQESASVLRWLAIGVFINCLARLPYTALQGKGRPDLTAKLHLAELPVYALVLWGLLEAYGITGAAAAWTLRIVVDTMALFILGMRETPELRAVQRHTVALMVVGSVLLAALALPQHLWLKIALAATIVALGSGLAFREIILMRASATGNLR